MFVAGYAVVGRLVVVVVDSVVVVYSCLAALLADRPIRSLLSILVGVALRAQVKCFYFIKQPASILSWSSVRPAARAPLLVQASKIQVF